MWFQGEVMRKDLINKIVECMTKPDSKGTPMWELLYKSNSGEKDVYLKSNGENQEDELYIKIRFNSLSDENYRPDKLCVSVSNKIIINKSTNYYFLVNADVTFISFVNMFASTGNNAMNLKETDIYKYYISVNRNRIILILKNSINPRISTNYSNIFNCNVDNSLFTLNYFGLGKRYNNNNDKNFIISASTTSYNTQNIENFNKGIKIFNSKNLYNVLTNVLNANEYYNDNYVFSNKLNYTKLFLYSSEDFIRGYFDNIYSLNNDNVFFKNTLDIFENENYLLYFCPLIQKSFSSGAYTFVKNDFTNYGETSASNANTIFLLKKE